MLTTYLIALLVGGLLVAASVLFGGDADADADVDVDADADADVDHDHGLPGIAGGLSVWLPFGSIRFWTFFLAFGGLTGTLLTAFDLAHPLVIALLSVAVGYVSGFGIASIVRRLRTEEVSSNVSEADYLGASATVLLPATRGEVGRVRIQIKGRDIDATALTEDDAGLSERTEVLVYDVRDDGVLLVTANDRPTTHKQRRAS